MNTCPIITPRCRQCGGPLEHFEGERYCPDCLGWTTNPDVIDCEWAGEDGDLIDPSRDA